MRVLLLERHAWETGGSRNQVQIPRDAFTEFFGDRSGTFPVLVGDPDELSPRSAELMLSHYAKSNTYRMNLLTELGDIGHAVIAIEELKQAKARYRIWWLTDPRASVILEDSSLDWSQAKGSQYGPGRKWLIVEQHVLASRLDEEVPRIVSVRLRRFKAAFDSGSVQLRPFTVVVGRNGTGKSTLIDALQWIDRSIRDDATRACDRTHGVHDLINYRTRKNPPSFDLDLRFRGSTKERWAYRILVGEVSGGRPAILAETLERGTGRAKESIFDERNASQRLRLSRPMASTFPVREFWRRAVFLRLSPHRLAQGSSSYRSTNEPMLEEEGTNLPALLGELTDQQRQDLVADVRRVLPDVEDISLSDVAKSEERRVWYFLHERMPNRGRAGSTTVPIPAWMLSEGTRRLTALLALLVHDPPPSLLCIEEIENGLDPWSVLEVMRLLRSAVSRGVQVVLTTHSVWLLDHVPLDSIVQVRRVKGETVYERFADREAIRDYSASVPPGTRYVREE